MLEMTFGNSTFPIELIIKRATQRTRYSGSSDHSLFKTVAEAGADPCRILVIGDSRVLTSRGALSPKFAQNRAFSLKIA